MNEGAPSPTEGREERRDLRHLARTLTAYRDRYGITETTPLGAPAENDAQRSTQSAPAPHLSKGGADRRRTRTV